MITFGNENLHQSINNNNIITSKKIDEFEILKKKYKKLEKENKALKTVIEELMGLTDNLKLSFKNTENMYLTINDVIQSLLKGKLYNKEATNNASDIFIKSPITDSHENICNFSRENSLNITSLNSISEFNKNPNQSLFLNNGNQPININLNSSTNITNIYNNTNHNEINNETDINNLQNKSKIESKNTTEIDNSSIKIDENNLKDKKDLNIEKKSEVNKKEILIDEKNYQSDINTSKSHSILKNTFEKEVILTLGEDLNNLENKPENKKSKKELLNSFTKNDEKNFIEEQTTEIVRKFSNNRDLIKNNEYNSNSNNYEHKERHSLETINKSDVLNINLENNNINEDSDKKESNSNENETKTHKYNYNNNINSSTNDNSTKDSYKNSNPHQNKFDIKSNKNFSSEVNLESEMEIISKLIFDYSNKKEDNNEEILNKLAESFAEMQKKFLQIKLEKDEYEKLNSEILKNLKLTEENYLIISSKYEELNKFIDIMYKTIHSILVLSDSTETKTQTIKCEPIPSYLKFINNIIN